MMFYNRKCDRCTKECSEIYKSKCLFLDDDYSKDLLCTLCNACYAEFKAVFSKFICGSDDGA